MSLVYAGSEVLYCCVKIAILYCLPSITKAVSNKGLTVEQTNYEDKVSQNHPSLLLISV